MSELAVGERGDDQGGERQDPAPQQMIAARDVDAVERRDAERRDVVGDPCVEIPVVFENAVREDLNNGYQKDAQENAERQHIAIIFEARSDRRGQVLA